MIIFDRENKILDVPSGLGNLEVNVSTALTPNDEWLIRSAVTESNAYTDDKVGALVIPTRTSELVNDSGFVSSADTPTTYVLNLMSQAERAALVNELLQYGIINHSAPSSGFPAEKYEFYYYSQVAQDNGAGFIVLRLNQISLNNQKVTFEGILNGYVGRKFKELSVEVSSNGNITPRENYVGVYTLNGQKGELTTKTINGESIMGEGNLEIVGAQGPQGETGAQGPQGETGAQGPQGEKGDKGDNGANGAQGPQGASGPQGAKGATGSKGDRGERGPQGYVGPQGPKGEVGQKGDRGERGPQGFQGPQGKIGPQGYTGPQGERGPQGEKGETGSQGPQGADGQNGTQGPQGERGPQGEKGETGAQGPQGADGQNGTQGPQGERGPQGEKGETGAQGPQGERGPQGPAGSAESSVTSGEVQTMIESALTDYYTSGQTDNAISAATQNFVTSTSVRIIWVGTTAQYEAITTKDPYTLYFINDN